MRKALPGKIRVAKVARKMSGQPKRGRPPKPAWLRRRRIYVRLLLPSAEEWRRILKASKYLDKNGEPSTTVFVQTMVDYLLASQPEGKKFREKVEREEGRKSDKRP